MTAGRIGDVVVYGQESNSTTRRLAMMNPAIRGIEGDLGPVYASKLEAAIKAAKYGDGGVACDSGRIRVAIHVPLDGMLLECSSYRTAYQSERLSNDPRTT